MFRELDEEFTRLIATAAALVGAALVVWDCMTNGPLTTGAHFALAMGAFTLVRLAVGRSLRPAHQSVPATDDDDDTQA